MGKECSTVRSQLLLLLAGTAMLSVSVGISETSFNNYYSDVFHLGADARGFLEFPRELPGFLTAIMTGLLAFAPETTLAGLSAAAVGIGMLGIAAWPAKWGSMLLFLTIWSAGTHLIMPVRSSLAMDLAGCGEKGKRLGQIQAVGIAASIVGCLIVIATISGVGTNYRLLYGLGGTAALAGSLFLFSMRMPGSRLERPKFVFNKRFSIYYALNLFFGARKQIFITFGPWVLVKIFHQPATIFAKMWIVASILGIAFQPLLGRAIDRFGERAVLMTDAALTAIVSLVYGFAHLIPDPRAAVSVLGACLVVDQLLFGTGMARDTYVAKIALNREQISPTLSLGVSINHAVSMSLPSLGGLVWLKYGHSAVFVGAAALSAATMIVSSMIRSQPVSTAIGHDAAASSG